MPTGKATIRVTNSGDDHGSLHPAPSPVPIPVDTPPWSFTALLAHLESRFRRQDDLRDAVIARMLEQIAAQAAIRDAVVKHINEQFRAQDEARTAADKRYEQRFIAQEGAVQSALVAQEKAVNAALTASDRAVLKAEIAAEKRFDAVNEFRGQLKDQAAGLLARTEAEARFHAFAEKMETMVQRQNDMEKRTIEALSMQAGRSGGISASWGVLVGAVGLIATIASVVGLLLGRN